MIHRKHHCSECHRDFVCDSQQCLLEIVYPCSRCDYNNQHMVSEYVDEPVQDVVICQCKESMWKILDYAKTLYFIKKLLLGNFSLEKNWL